MIRNSKLNFLIDYERREIRFEKNGICYKKKPITLEQINRLLIHIWNRVYLDIGKVYPLEWGFRYKGNDVQPK